jgi:hypothetical protein
LFFKHKKGDGMECEECSNEAEDGFKLCAECLEYYDEITEHEWAEPEAEELTQVGTHKWVSKSGSVYTDTGEGEDSWLDNDSDAYLDGRD